MSEPRYTALTEDELKDRLQAVMTERNELLAALEAYTERTDDLEKECARLYRALEDAPFLEWDEFTPAGERENMLVEYDLWYNDECQAALGGGDD